jgi:hypothetical protein
MPTSFLTPSSPRHQFPEYGDTAMEEEEEGDEWASVEPADDLSRVISDAK